MKLFYLIIPIVALLFISCSSTYNATNFNSKNDFYKYVNKHINNRAVNVTLNNDSTFTTKKNGVHIDSSNYLSFQLNRTVKDTTLALSEIQNIDYKAGYGSALLKLKNGKVIDAENVRRSKENIEFSGKFAYPSSIPVNKINKIGYKNVSVGVLSGILIGIASGVLVTISRIIPANRQEGTPPYHDDYDYYGVGVASIGLGIIVGGILGGIIGHHYNFEFR